MSPDGRVQSRVENYAKFWDKDSAQDGQAQMDNRLDQYTEVVNGASSVVLGPRCRPSSAAALDDQPLGALL